MKRSDIEKEISCMDDFDPGSLSPEQALEKIFDGIAPVTETELLPIRDALNRVSASNIHSPVNVPAGRNSAMDGYAIRAEDLPEKGTATLELIGSAFAGSPFRGKLENGKCVRIMTGALIPAGADTVIIQEHVRADGKHIHIDGPGKAGGNIRQAGEDLATGDVVLEKGMKLTPAGAGLLASLGIAEIKVYRPVRVAFFSTGDELRSLGEPLEAGAIYDSNRYTLYGMLSQPGGIEISDMGIIRDERELIEQAFLAVKDRTDVLLTSGGASVGEADYIKEVLLKNGQIMFEKVAIKPGRPLVFGRLGSSHFFGLPGNPVSVMVTFYQFVQPALKRLAGERMITPLVIQAHCVSTLKKRPGRVEYQRGVLEQGDNGKLLVRKTGVQGSGILRSMADANCFIILPLDSEEVRPGDMVTVQPFYGLT